jgi:hypothetical protein
VPLPLPDVESLKTYANITRSVNDEELGTFLDAAIDLVEGIVGRVQPVEVTETHYGLASPVLVLREAPVAELLAISAPPLPGQPVVPYALTDYLLDGATGTVRSAYGSQLWGDLTVTYTAGTGVVPDGVWLAILIIAGTCGRRSAVRRRASSRCRTGISPRRAGPGSPSPTRRRIC